MTDFKTIKKTKQIKESSNLVNYEKSYKDFLWHHVEKDLSKNSNNILNAAYIAVDRHKENDKKNKIALYYESENGTKEQYTFTQISDLSNQFANLLKENGAQRGERIFIFLPRIPELFISFLGILKTGAIAGTLFSAFQEKALLDRLLNSEAKIIVTDSFLYPRIKKIIRSLPNVQKIVIVERNAKILPTGSKIIYFSKEISRMDKQYKIKYMQKDDPAFMLYTSGTTGKPKGVIHKHLAIVQQFITAKYVLDLKDNDVYWCTADPGWVTGIAYEILGTWANGVSTVIYDGRFDPDKWYKIIQDYKVSVWYTAPTAVRMLMSKPEAVKKFNLSTLRHIASVGEPLNPEAVVWGLKAFKLPFHDTWWQTETGAMCIVNLRCMNIKPGSMGRPFPGIVATIVDDKGNELPAGKEGNIALKPGFPSLMKTIWRRPQKFKSYFLKGWYISGDRGLKDKDGYFWFISRADDVIKTSGERVGPFEVESVLVENKNVVEAGVIGKPDPLRGEIIKAFVVLKDGIKQTEKLKDELSTYVKKNLAGHAYPREIEFIDKLPKTRSGKIMRRVLKAKELGLPIGDTSTLEEY